ncbi:acyltransferase family protein [Coprobacter tertius]|uniref:Acyltransferase n=1 Tax=Coprobacter tertius TaxID=2944915 RepID=A0ABT1MH49_9BACT|nr:acyltransferase [Coprobacter tertius]MCP9611950.1 acyltransferase [Coprobacter tertius]
MRSRINQIDYLKCVFIILMVIFHLVYIGDKYPYAKQIVYTFHMPAFLVISGYLVNVRKSTTHFFNTMLWIFIPYTVMELGYVLMSAILPVRESVSEITVYTLLNKIFISPLGPYWYLHTLIICSTTYYILFRLFSFVKPVSLIILLGICLWGMDRFIGVLSFENAIYFIIGIIFSLSGQNFLSFFKPSLFALIPLAILCYYPINLDRFTLSGIIIVWLVINVLIWLYDYLPQKIKSSSVFIGRNTLVILLFSPIFTILSKIFLPYLSFDKTGIIFMCISLILVFGGCFFIAWCMDKMNLSRFFCGKTNIIQL